VSLLGGFGLRSSGCCGGGFLCLLLGDAVLDGGEADHTSDAKDGAEAHALQVNARVLVAHFRVLRTVVTVLIVVHVFHDVCFLFVNIEIDF